MRRLIDIARRNGFHQMFTIEATGNEPMHELALYLGFREGTRQDDATQLVHTLDL